MLVISTAGELVILIYKYNFNLYFFQSRLKLTCILQYAHTRTGFKWKQKKGKELIEKWKMALLDNSTFRIITFFQSSSTLETSAKALSNLTLSLHFLDKSQSPVSPTCPSSSIYRIWGYYTCSNFEDESHT